jgi:hypothetical protein
MAKAPALPTDPNKAGLTTSEFWSSQTPLGLAVAELMRPPPANWYEASVRITIYIAVAAAVVSYNQNRGRIKSSSNEAKAAIATAKE